MASVEILGQTDLDANTASVTFSGLDTTTYTYFEMLGSCRSAHAAAGAPGNYTDYMMVRFGEADSIISANQSYSWSGVFATDGSTGTWEGDGDYSTVASTETSWMGAGLILNNNSLGVGDTNNCPIRIQFFGGMSGYLSMFQCESFAGAPSGSGYASMGTFMGQRATGQTAALTDIQLLTYSGSNFLAGSSFILTGWKEEV